MSHIGDLIRQHCPDGVPYKTLDEVGSFTRGSGLQKKDFTETGFPCIHYGQIYTHYGISATQTKSFIDPAQAARLHRAQPGDLIIATTSENDEDVCKAVAWLGDGEVAVSNDACFYHHELDAKYVSYWIQSTDFQRQKDQWITGTKVRRVSVRNLERALIPVPPLPVQEEIVKILDTFTDLESELESELESRRLQYKLYQEKLLTPSSDTHWSTLGEISTRVSSGATPLRSRPDYYEDGTIPWLRTQEVDFNEITDTAIKITPRATRESSAKLIPEHCVIVAMYGATAAKVATNLIPLTTNQACCNLQIDPSVASYRYVFHWVKNQYQRLRGLGEGSQSNLNAKKVKSFPIPVPSLREQERIAADLDTFDALVNDLSSGLPAELNARRQQYEYYRDKLLTFKELKS
ncbi:restriction endonuclease subunit S [Propionibacterium freudenreichii]|uniref:restriction endonuclease subunit S n=2 Tax=Propionibacterium freudenreichii TaxID=1744 RepID=UPI00254B74A8|nr:restriction endonuclease subunit S [Propionibacterium freudenreichii]MDK9626382.1 restriction endonuclease subunit S [Propionibacterium freudenreichii]